VSQGNLSSTPEAPTCRPTPFLDACRGATPSHIPIWLMRQAGRYMSEYRELRSKVTFMELCHTPELACEVTVHAADVLQTDAAILFADILLILELFGVKVELVKGKGPQITPPLRDPQLVDKLPEPDLEGLSTVYQAVRMIKDALPRERALIGFAGAPFTVASYLIEGGPSKNFEHTKKMMFGAPEQFKSLLKKIGRATGEYLKRQVEAGADAIQLFDSWVGNLSEADYREYVLPASKLALAAVPAHVPRIHFGKGTGHLLLPMRDAGATIMGVDEMTHLGQARKLLGDTPVQGNLDPIALLCDRPTIKKMVLPILAQGGQSGYIFNLGHGIIPSTPVDNVRYLVDLVHEETAR
jgi:uroporphyrinogen decarboxylase